MSSSWCCGFNNLLHTLRLWLQARDSDYVVWKFSRGLSYFQGAGIFKYFTGHHLKLEIKIEILYTLQTYLIISENWVLLHALALLNIIFNIRSLHHRFFLLLLDHTPRIHTRKSRMATIQANPGECSRRRRKKRWWRDQILKWCSVELKHEVVWLLRPFPLHFSFTTVLPLLSTRELFFHFHFLSRG